MRLYVQISVNKFLQRQPDKWIALSFSWARHCLMHVVANWAAVCQVFLLMLLPYTTHHQSVKHPKAVVFSPVVLVASIINSLVGSVSLFIWMFSLILSNREAQEFVEKFEGALGKGKGRKLYAYKVMMTKVICSFCNSQSYHYMIFIMGMIL